MKSNRELDRFNDRRYVINNRSGLNMNKPKRRKRRVTRRKKSQSPVFMALGIVIIAFFLIYLITSNNVFKNYINAVFDHTPPAGQALNAQIWLGETIFPSKLVTNVTDNSSVKYSFKAPPDLSQIGQQEVIIILKDESGNKTEITSQLTIKKDDQAPVISGVADQRVFIGTAVLYKKNVTVTDNRDTDVKLEIDSSTVNLTKAGNYTVTYSATDSSGNKTEKTAVITVAAKTADDITEQDLNVYVDKILAEIIKPDMTELEKINVVYYWVFDHISYTGTSDKSSWIKSAYLSITKGSGDCYNYYTTIRALLTRAGFDVVSVERVPGTKTHHYWNMVKYNGEYYHIDATPTLNHKYVCMLRSDPEVEAYSKLNLRYYEYDKTKVPAAAQNNLTMVRTRLKK